jgi:hypothetical protein
MTNSWFFCHPVTEDTVYSLCPVYSSPINKTLLLKFEKYIERINWDILNSAVYHYKLITITTIALLLKYDVNGMCWYYTVKKFYTFLTWFVHLEPLVMAGLNSWWETNLTLRGWNSIELLRNKLRLIWGWAEVLPMGHIIQILNWGGLSLALLSVPIKCMHRGAQPIRWQGPWIKYTHRMTNNSASGD